MEKIKNWITENYCSAPSLTKVSLPGFFFVLFLLLITFSPAPAQAEEVSAASQRVLNKVYSGQVGAATGQGFALVYKEEADTEYEMWLPFHQTVLFTGGYSGPDDLTVGDRVQISYDETEDKKKRSLKSVSLVKKGEPPVFAEETEVTEEIDEAAAEPNE